MFWENGNQPILTEFRGCFHDTEESENSSRVNNKIIENRGGVD
jgi:hypothetical protein